MSFWDSVKKFTQPYGDDDYEDYDEDETEGYEEEETPVQQPARRRAPAFGGSGSGETGTGTSAPSTGFSGQVVSMGGKQEVVLYHAKSFDDAAKAADELRKKKAVILNMENVDKSLIRRVVDFLSGSVYALDGSVKKIAQSTYLFCPHNMDVVGDLENIQLEAESYI
jgi:FtsZ-interacting cell division protein YlmF